MTTSEPKPETCLIDGSPVTDDHRNLKENGQQKGYVVLTEEERAKGFVQPVRDSYIHVGIQPKYPVRDLTDEEQVRFGKCKYIKFEEYPKEKAPLTGRFWTQVDLEGGCGSLTKMAVELAETYARAPGFYGSTFCCGCGKHLPVSEFVWDGTEQRVGA